MENLYCVLLAIWLFMLKMAASILQIFMALSTICVMLINHGGLETSEAPCAQEN